MIEVVRSDDAPSHRSVAELTAEAVTGSETLVVRSEAEERQAKRVATVIDAIRAAR
ncbi:MAG: hypothetical protein ABI276_01540 [Acidimicrobiales bacterium]